MVLGGVGEFVRGVTGGGEARGLGPGRRAIRGRFQKIAAFRLAHLAEAAASLRRCTYAGRPYGSEDFVNNLSRRFGRHWKRGRPKADSASVVARAGEDAQFNLFAE
jgi:hypothetical protein